MEEKKYNLGWALLKLWICFKVVLVHAWEPGAIGRALVWASGFSMGVYFTHIYVGKLLETLLFPSVGVVPRSFVGGVLVFLVSFALCVAIFHHAQQVGSRLRHVSLQGTHA